MNKTKPTSCLRCKSIEHALRKEDVNIQDINNIFKKSFPNKVINKSYNSIGHLSVSRLGEGDRHIDKSQEEFLTQKFPPIKCILYIEEKMDGSNVAVIRKGGDLVAIGRSGYPCQESNLEQHRRFAKWVQSNHSRFDELLPNENDRVVGEWLALAHGTLYKDLPSPFMAFELYYEGKAQNVETKRSAFDRVGIENVPLLIVSNEPVSVDKALLYANAHNPISEGVVYRLERFDKNKDKMVPFIIAKVVKQDKEDGKYLVADNPIWLWEDNK